MKNSKQQNNYAFIDSQNLHLSIRDLGWILDFRRFRIHLRDRYGIKKAFLFMGYVPSNEAKYASLQQMGYMIIFKPTLETKKGIIKGNCDAELVLHSMIEYPEYDKAIIVSGDGDFHCLIEYLEKQNKLLMVGIPQRHRYSSLLRKFRQYFFFVSDVKEKVQLT